MLRETPYTGWREFLLQHLCWERFRATNSLKARARGSGKGEEEEKEGGLHRQVAMDFFCLGQGDLPALEVCGELFPPRLDLLLGLFSRVDHRQLDRFVGHPV